MKISFDLTSLYDWLVSTAKTIDYFTCFFVVFISVGCFFAVKFSLNLLAGKKVKLSLFDLLSLFAISLVSFLLGYLEYETDGVIFDELYKVVRYAVGEFIAITVLYAVFLSFARGEKREISGDAVAVTTAFDACERKQRETLPVYSLSMIKGYPKKDRPVDFSGVYAFLDGLDGADEIKVRALKEKISFFDGLEISGDVKSALNDLFYETVKLASAGK